MCPLDSRSLLASLPRQWRSAVQWVSTVGLIWLCLASTVCAQQFGEEPEEKTYVPSYMIIVFAVGLALLMICRSGKRTTSFRREE
jgi:hypothetical protein